MEYPRPDFQRTPLKWASLNGPWDFLFDDSDSGLSSWPRHGLPDKNKTTIQVPFAFQTAASGINDQSAHEVIWYERRIRDLRSGQQVSSERLLLRFGAVDYECSVWVDGVFAGEHRGGHVPFDLEISSLTSPEKEHRLTIRVRDSPSDLTQPRGKQYWAPIPESIFYTPTSGIWQSVWLESVPRVRLGDASQGTLLRSDDLQSGLLHARIVVLGRQAGASVRVEMEARLGGRLVGVAASDLPKDQEFALLDLDMKVKESRHEGLDWQNDVAVWSPQHPTLYDLRLRLLDGSNTLLDEVHTTTGMRRLSWSNGDGSFRLNGQPIFQLLVLDQGYWPHTGLTPPSQQALKDDIQRAQAMGFTGCRKHQKVEDPVFLYWADRLGYLVWGEMANAYAFGHEYIDRFNAEWTAAVRRDINHPSVIAWTPVNESWGYPALKGDVHQRNHLRSLYYLTKTLDDSRPVNDNCGWEHVHTDLTTFHDYADAADLARTCASLDGILGPKADHAMFVQPLHPDNQQHDAGSRHSPGAPVICTEFGGVNIAPARDSPAGERDWGYTTALDAADLLARLERLVMAVAGGHTCGLVYTQLYDIEQEVNGLYTYDRKAKIPPEEVKKIMQRAFRQG
ncbi:hypothetical protein ASPZODRAFT_153910 [Penicilliopsis zonata CBS 506.65]|uniref:Glycoside hydrolase family 2 immunoglobulin-like beta-sandwich domain-containing protein n=1 Tax=Penicilliopsis zonata CBS 506.65 TaxID=1073090 RepID=A0A1L9S9S6_9EURO|nr:hypothetical protein ASPZODRAFT_153910 [Penicilliopsis zonata CBS 506.65]OJJ43920.1 hypothetical protein ASPZODRAFT_153910 [Penicilliopsis zonata CBS 506.65]